MISGLGGFSPQKPAHAGLPLPGIHPVLLDPNGHDILENNVEGLLCISRAVAEYDPNDIWGPYAL